MPSPVTPPTTNPASASDEDAVQELTPVDLDRLQILRGYPMVSVLMPTTPGTGLSPAESTTLNHLIDRAERRLAAELPATRIAEIIDPLRDLADRVTRARMGPGLALFGGAGLLEAYRLPLQPQARAVIDPTFATRDLARAVLENPPYRLLVLASGTARLYVGADRHLGEQVAGGFPLGEARSSGTTDRRGHLHQAERTHRDSRRWDSFLRQVDKALSASTRSRDLPLILAATEPLASRFQQRTTHHLIGTVAGNHQRTTAARLADLARPIVEDHLASERRHALEALDDAIGRRRAVFGIDDVWREAHDGNVVLLLVDPDYRLAAVPSPDGRSLEPSSDREHPAVIDDAVDEVIEAVERHGGHTCFTSMTTGRSAIAAVLRTT